jgi:hypothetical protein
MRLAFICEIVREMTLIERRLMRALGSFVAWELRAAALKSTICSAGGPHAPLRWQVKYFNAVHLGSLSKCRTFMQHQSQIWMANCQTLATGSSQHPVAAPWTALNSGFPSDTVAVPDTVSHWRRVFSAAPALFAENDSHPPDHRTVQAAGSIPDTSCPTDTPVWSTMDL